MAEVMKYDDFKAEGSEAAVKVHMLYSLSLSVMRRVTAEISSRCLDTFHSYLLVSVYGYTLLILSWSHLDIQCRHKLY